MGQLLSCVVVSGTWCLCTATGSLLTACCGNDKKSTEPVGANSGRKRSVLLMVIAMIVSFVFQYWVASAVVESYEKDEIELSVSALAKEQATNFFQDSWLDGCTEYESSELRERCVGNSGVYRAASAATLFFLLAAIAVKCKPSFNREVWPAKYILFLFLCAATIFIPNEPVFSDIYLNIARVGGALFIVVQQIIFIDMAFNWNDSWVEKSNQAEAEETGAGNKWLVAILVAVAILFLGSLTVIGLMFHFFGGCAISNAFISVTLILCIVVTVAQMTGEEGSLLSSAVTTAYATYLCFSALSRNPDATCNPKLGEEDLTGIVLGVGITMISLGWTGWSYTAGKALDVEDDRSVDGASAPNTTTNTKDEERKVTGVVTGTSSYGSTKEEGATGDAADLENSAAVSSNRGFSNSWKLNMVLALISCWFAMALTSWGSVASGGNSANPEVGKVSMWIMIASQWLFMALYSWSLVAPRLFPDRDFS
ncbi:Serine incorporator 1 [Seminavis robusta]|uniref:Serine incorporator 1 n=1 Tax=Seminavis robusta TaxID=568900 RepID=A0A9N8HLF8_9STRA|nr:Serine incorporator 1 [Seminavis robusta]|eukprot:Sro1026_g232940.1 Serine incorporator 1 (482) ;mRNA; r:29879-31411